MLKGEFQLCVLPKMCHTSLRSTTVFRIHYFKCLPRVLFINASVYYEFQYVNKISIYLSKLYLHKTAQSANNSLPEFILYCPPKRAGLGEQM